MPLNNLTGNISNYQRWIKRFGVHRNAIPVHHIVPSPAGDNQQIAYLPLDPRPMTVWAITYSEYIRKII